MSCDKRNVAIESYGKSYCGRCTIWQSLNIDECIENIAKDMQILGGMKNEWKTP